MLSMVVVDLPGVRKGLLSMEYPKRVAGSPLHWLTLARIQIGMDLVEPSTGDVTLIWADTIVAAIKQATIVAMIERILDTIFYSIFQSNDGWV
jgi:hypothetical protein